MSTPAVSVAMIARNHEAFVAQAVESVMDQRTDFPVDLVVGDDASTDRTPEILAALADRHAGRIRLLPAAPRLGPAANYVRTLTACRARYVAVLEGDDYWTDPAKLQRQVDLLERRPDLAACFHPVRTVTEPPSGREKVYPPRRYRREVGLRTLLWRNVLNTNAVMYRNEPPMDLPEFVRSVLPADWPVHILQARRGPFGFLPETMGVYRRHAGGLWSRRRLEEILPHCIDMLRQLDRHLEFRHRTAIARTVWKYRAGLAALKLVRSVGLAR